MAEVSGPAPGTWPFIPVPVFAGPSFAVPDHRVPRRADGCVVNANSHPAHASNPSP